LRIQTDLHRLIKEATLRTESLLDKYASACKTINSQMPEITIALHERVESYIKELQLRLGESEGRNSKLREKVEAAEKWMEAIKAMEALASFSRRKIRNWEGIHAAKPKDSKVCCHVPVVAFLAARGTLPSLGFFPDPSSPFNRKSGSCAPATIVR
jgi:flagellar biosynthesis chaperone FliJ